MISFLLIAIGISMVILSRFKGESLIVIILIALNENIFNLVGVNLSSLVAVLGIFLFVINLDNIIKKKYIFKKYVFTLILVCGLSQLYATYKWGQPLIYGLFGMHYIFIYLYYFIFVNIFKKDKLKQIKDIIIILSSILCIIYFIQYLIYPNFVIFKMNYAYRNGNVRFFSGYILIMFSIILIYSDLLFKFKFKLFICLVVQILSLAIVSQTRNYIIGIFIVLMLGLILKNRKTNVLFLYFSLLIIFIYITFFLDEKNYINNILNSVFSEFNSKSGTVGVRIDELSYYINLLKDNLLFGIGILDSRFLLTPIITGYVPYYYYVSDLGLFGVIIYTGLIGGIWLALFLYKIFKCSINFLKFNDKYSYLMILTAIFIVALFPSGLVFNKNAILYICIFISMCEVNYKKIGDNYVNKKLFV
ncbi:hypothetical protein GNF72_10200 [Clostridium perfringens]|nr:hypothetical protein [Clostridium perfringens]